MTDETPSPPLPDDELHPGPGEEPEAGPLRFAFGFFLLPLAIVLVAVGVFLLFGKLATTGKSAEDYLDEVRSARFPNQRGQAAFELSRTIVGGKIRDRDAFTSELIEACEEARTEAPEVRRYLVMTLGQLGGGATVPALLEALRDPDSETVLYAMDGLARSRDPRALEPIAGLLAHEDAGIRKMAAFALGGLGLPEAVPALTAALNDRQEDVRWNAAVALSVLGSAAGEETLLPMLDRAAMERVPGITAPQVELAMVQAIESLGRIRSARAVPAITGLSVSDPSLQVRQAALVFLEGSRAPAR